MAQIKGGQFEELTSYNCPKCNKYYERVIIGTDAHSCFSPWFFCTAGCARYFDINGKDITTKVTRLYHSKYND